MDEVGQATTRQEPFIVIEHTLIIVDLFIARASHCFLLKFREK